MEETICKGVPVFPDRRAPLSEPHLTLIPFLQQQSALTDLFRQPKRPDFTSFPRLWLKQLMLLARQGDTRATEFFYWLTEPLIVKYCNVPYFVSILGKDDIRSIAALSIIDFVMNEPLKDGEQDISRMLKRVIHCDLLNHAHLLERRGRFEKHCNSSSSGEENDDTETDELAVLPADRQYEPEYQALQEERKRIVRECLQCLGSKEMYVINGIFFKQRSVAEIAEELHCSAVTVSLAKYNALKKLRRVFKEKDIA